MDRQRSYSLHETTEHKSHTTAIPTSSAFSPCANANEDWTKISDLAERRRIQNRIAQRNYRKKLKKRLEDLERRANSSSASPEQKPRELDLSLSPPKTTPALSRTPSQGAGVSKRKAISHTRAVSDGSRLVAPEERRMFSQQHMRQISPSPPPFSFSTSYGSYDAPATPQFSQPYMSPPFMSTDTSSYPSYMPNLNQGFTNPWPSKPQPIKQECFGEVEMSPFSMSYASMAGGVDVPYTSSYSEQPLITTPDLSDTCDYSSAGSPGELAMEFAGYPLTPLMMPMTPPLQAYEM